MTSGMTGMIAQREQKSLKGFLQPGIDENQLWGLKNGLLLQGPQVETHCSRD